MHRILADQIVEIARVRDSEGDCKLTKAESIERYEWSLINFADRLKEAEKALTDLISIQNPEEQACDAIYRRCLELIYSVRDAESYDSRFANLDLLVSNLRDFRSFSLKQSLAQPAQELMGYGNNACPTCGKSQSEIEAALKDAERYRWLRRGDNDEAVLQNGPIDMTYWYLPRNEKLDALIDAAIAEEGKGKT